MPQPQPKPALTKAPRKAHPAAPNATAAPAADQPRATAAADTNADQVQINVRVPKSVRTRVKRSALDADQTVNEWMLDAIESKLAG